MAEKQDFILKEASVSNGAKAADASADSPGSGPADQKKPGPEGFDAESQLPAINFATFIFSLNSSAMVQLGIMDDPVTGKKARNLPLAKQTIDILGLLEEKTRGNLSGEEGDMLKHILYDLRILYVKEKG